MKDSPIELLCLGCELATCNESHKDCAFQNAKEVRTVPVKSEHLLMPVAVSIAVQKRREQWRAAKDRMRAGQAVSV